MNRAQRRRRIKAMRTMAKRRGVMRVIDKTGLVAYPPLWRRLLRAMGVS
jgi:hypothetical protein